MDIQDLLKILNIPHIQNAKCDINDLSFIKKFILSRQNYCINYNNQWFKFTCISSYEDSAIILNDELITDSFYFLFNINENIKYLIENKIINLSPKYLLVKYYNDRYFMSIYDNFKEYRCLMKNDTRYWELLPYSFIDLYKHLMNISFNFEKYLDFIQAKTILL